jgi:8-oxo-dGTP diphosphatase
MGAGVLFTNAAGDPLLVEPTYKDTWEIPGGLVEAGEDPRTCAMREVREELGWDPTLPPACHRSPVPPAATRRFHHAHL